MKFNIDVDIVDMEVFWAIPFFDTFDGDTFDFDWSVDPPVDRSIPTFRRYICSDGLWLLFDWHSPTYVVHCCCWFSVRCCWCKFISNKFRSVLPTIPTYPIPHVCSILRCSICCWYSPHHVVVDDTISDPTFVFHCIDCRWHLVMTDPWLSSIRVLVLLILPCYWFWYHCCCCWWLYSEGSDDYICWWFDCSNLT